MKLDFYYLNDCPYCVKVQSFITNHNLESKFAYHEISKDEEAHDRLKRMLDGDDQVPCLVIDGRPMLESEDIIAWLKENVIQKKRAS